MAVFPATSASAIEPPPEEATPPAAMLMLQDSPPQQVAEDPSPFMGVVTAEVPEMLADHLGLSERSGIIIRTVCPDSPAEKAGLSVNDVVTKLNGDPVANTDDFSSTVRSRKVGDRLRIDLIHKGKPAKVEVTLRARPADATAQLNNQETYLGGIPRNRAERLRGLFEQNNGSIDPRDLRSLRESRFEDSFRRMQDRMNRAFGDNGALGTGEGISFGQNSTIRLMDGNGSVEILSSKGDTRVSVRDRGNKVVWSGAWNSEEDKAAAPDDIRERIGRMRGGNGTGFSFRLGDLRRNSDTVDN